MYLVGNFSIGDNSDKLGLVSVVDEISKKNLQDSAYNSDYHVIDLERKEYYNPAKNCWEKLKFNWK